MPPLVFLSNPQDIWSVITADPTILHPGAGAAMLKPLVGEGAFMLSEEEKHRFGRNTIMPTFHQKMLKEHTDTVAGIIEQGVQAWPLDTAFPLHPHLRGLALKVFLNIIFGNEDDKLKELHRRVLDMLSITPSLVLQEPRLRYLPGWHQVWRRFVRQRSEVDRLIYSLIAQRHRGCGARGDLLDMLLAARHPDGSSMSDRQIHDDLMAMIVAGHETAAAELAWAFQLLAHNPTVQSRLIREIDDDAGEEYLTATVNETLRHKPVFLFAIPRAVMQPIEIGGWTYCPPAHLLGCTYLMHHDPHLYPNPDEFRPERFIDATPQPRTWLPWGGGHKRCPGRHLALLEMQAVLRTALSTRTVQPASTRIEHAQWRSVIITPHAGSRVILRKRRPASVRV